MQLFNCDEENLKNFAYEIYRKLKPSARPVFLCVGSDKFVCDSMAPIVAEMLTKKYNINAYVYGGLDYNINGRNLNVAINYIEAQHPESQIILVDATVGDNVGKVEVCAGTFAGMGKLIPIKKIGNFSILAVVGKKEKTFDLNSVRLANVYNLSKFIAKGIAMAISVTRYDKICL